MGIKTSEDLIKRSDAITAIAQLCAWHGSEGAWVLQEDVIEALENVTPSESKRGEWVYDMNQYYKCTNCGHLTLMPDSGSVFVPDWDEYQFCPNCGALMGERESE